MQESFENIRTWHRSILLQCQNLQFTNCEELLTGLLFSIVAEKHLLICVDDEIYDLLGQQILYALENLVSIVLGSSTATATIDDYCTANDIKQLFFDKDDSASKKEKHGNRSHLGNNSGGVDSDSNMHIHQASWSAVASSNRRESGALNSSSFGKPQPLHRGSLSSASSLILNMPCPDTYAILDHLCPILKSRQVSDGKVLHMLARNFIVLLFVPSSAARFLSRYCTDFFFYQVRINSQVYPSFPSSSSSKPAQQTLGLIDLPMISELQSLLPQIQISPPLVKFMRDYCVAIRRHPLFCGGLSLKACQDFEIAAKLCAMIVFGLNTVMPEHILLVAPSAIGHCVKLRETIFRKHDKELIDRDVIIECIQEVYDIVPKSF